MQFHCTRLGSFSWAKAWTLHYRSTRAAKKSAEFLKRYLKVILQLVTLASLHFLRMAISCRQATEKACSGRGTGEQGECYLRIGRMNPVHVSLVHGTLLFLRGSQQAGGTAQWLFINSHPRVYFSWEGLIDSSYDSINKVRSIFKHNLITIIPLLLRQQPS